MFSAETPTKIEQPLANRRVKDPLYREKALLVANALPTEEISLRLRSRPARYAHVGHRMAQRIDLIQHFSSNISVWHRYRHRSVRRPWSIFCKHLGVGRHSVHSEVPLPFRERAGVSRAHTLERIAATFLAGIRTAQLCGEPRPGSRMKPAELAMSQSTNACSSATPPLRSSNATFPRKR